MTKEQIYKAFNEALGKKMPGGVETYEIIGDWCDHLFRRFGSGNLVGILCFLAGMMMKEVEDGDVA